MWFSRYCDVLQGHVLATGRIYGLTFDMYM